MINDHENFQHLYTTKLFLNVQYKLKTHTERRNRTFNVRVKGRKTTYETYDLTLYQHERINLL